MQFAGCMQFGAVHGIAANDIQTYSLCDQSHRQTECIRPVLAACEQCHLRFYRCGGADGWSGDIICVAAEPFGDIGRYG